MGAISTAIALKAEISGYKTSSICLFHLEAMRKLVHILFIPMHKELYRNEVGDLKKKYPLYKRVNGFTGVEKNVRSFYSICRIIDV